jgi:8-oxo-dGTP diphosphatase
MADYLRWLRGQIGSALVPLVYATAIVRDPDGRVLFQRRADFGSAWWGLPGGVLEPRETPAAAAQREVWEETGLQVEIERLAGIYSSPRYLVTYPNGDRVQQVTLCYVARPTGGAIRPQAAEISELRFWEPDALPPRPLWYADMLRHAAQGQVAAYFDPPEVQALEAGYANLPAIRQVIGRAPLVWPGAAAAVLDRKGRLLLVRRADTGRWGLPGGGLEAGESLAHTVMREAREETGLEVEPTAVLDVHAGHEIVYPNDDRLYPVSVVFACQLGGGRLNAEAAEVLEARFFARSDLPALAPQVQALVDSPPMADFE